jgi:plastocyanin
VTRARPLVAVAASLAALIAITGVADAANRRIAISDYRWSDPDIHIDLGEHVTWYWIGPDLMHSVTGDPPNAVGIDSDPQTNTPRHQIGDTFKLDFNTPGTYSFTCKLHSAVHGTVTVSATPGDPGSEPDPVPESRVDLQPPSLRGLGLADRVVHHRGTRLRFALDEGAKVDAEFYRRHRRGPREYMGFETWKGHIGLNDVRFAAPGKRFAASPGRYLAVLRATDRNHNVGKPRKLRLAIRPHR